MRGFSSLKAFFALRPTNPYLFWAQVGEWPISVAHVLFFFFLVSPSFSEQNYSAMYCKVLSVLSLLGLNNTEQRNSCIWIACNEKNPGLCSTYVWSLTLLTREYKETAHMLYSNYPIS
jgi:hypothetical protein